MAQIKKTVGLLATGDELTRGDVLETNNFYMADRLQSHQIQVGLHVTASDEQADIEAGMRFLLDHHDVLIVSGGLGPTSDDRTRFALAAVLHEELIFFENCWENIKTRLQKLNLSIPENNRLQCLFPKNAIIFANNNGTAAACQVSRRGKEIFLLPGPPSECYPIFEKNVLPVLIENHYAQHFFHQEWLLLNVSEGSIAQALDPLGQNSGCEIGYRVNYPYLEFKCRSQNEAALQTLIKKIIPIIEPFVVSTRKQKASAQLIDYIYNTKIHIHIQDNATGGLLSAMLLQPETYPFLEINTAKNDKNILAIEIKGLGDYWKKQETLNPLVISIQEGGKEQVFQKTVPFRKERTPLYAVEIACWIILQSLQSTSSKLQ